MTRSGSDTVLHMPCGDNTKTRMSLMDKWRNHYYGRGQDEETTRFSNMAATAYFWFTCVTLLYVMLSDVIVFNFIEYGETLTYYMKVIACFIFVNGVANWACVRFYGTALERTEDRPDIQKLLWDDHPSDSLPKQNGYHDNEQLGVKSKYGNHQVTGNYGSSSSSCYSNGYTGGLERPKSPDISGLRWRYCHTCRLEVPPRAHHCKICNKCILKRDHHCYMTGVCIGYFNQRYFIMLSFFTALSSTAGLVLIANYLYHAFLPSSEWTDFVLPVTAYRWLCGAYSYKYVLMMCHMYTLLWTAPTGFGFFCWHIFLVMQGKTSHEVTKEVRVRCTASKAENFRDVFGAFWGLNFFFPTQIIFRQLGDGKYWDTLKRC